MIQSIRRVFESVEKTLHTLASHGESGEQPWDNEQNLYKKDLMICASQLGGGVDVDVKMEAVRKMGHFAYTGGAEAAKCAGSYLPTLADILKNKTSSTVLKIEVVKALSEICRAHQDNSQQAHYGLELVPVLAKFVPVYGDSSLARWSCYALVVLCSSGWKVVRTLMDYSDADGRGRGGGFRDGLEEMEEASWKGWPRNYAAVLRDFLGHVTVDLNAK